MRHDLAVVLCTFNGARFIRPQVRSILEQTLLPEEIHVYDDGSTDDTLALIAEEFALRPARSAGVALVVHEFDGERRGASGNFERGMRAVDAELVALSDQDDVWHADRLARGVQALTDIPDVVLVASNATFIDEHGASTGRSVFEAQRVEGWELRLLSRRRSLPVLVRRNIVPGMTFLVRRSFVEQLDPLPPGTMHDYRMVIEAAARDGAVIISDPLVDYRIHGRNAIGLDAGNRSLRGRMRARLQLIRTPLTDLSQWSLLAESLRRQDPAGHLRLVLDKLEFERRRRFPGVNGFARVIALIRLVLGGDYRRFDVGGWRGAVKDFARPPAQDGQGPTAARTPHEHAARRPPQSGDAS